MQRVLVIYRWHVPQQVLYILNFSSGEQQIPVDPVDEPWKLAMHSLGNNRTGMSLSIYGQQSSVIYSPPESFLLFIEPYV